MLTNRAPYLPNGKAYKLQTWCTDGGRQPASATGAVTSNVKGQGRKLTWSVWAVLAKCCPCHYRPWAYRVSRTRRLLPHFLFVVCYFRQGGDYAVRSVCLSICLSVYSHTRKLVCAFIWNYYLM